MIIIIFAIAFRCFISFNFDCAKKTYLCFSLWETNALHKWKHFTIKSVRIHAFAHSNQPVDENSNVQKRRHSHQQNEDFQNKGIAHMNEQKPKSPAPPTLVDVLPKILNWTCCYFKTQNDAEVLQMKLKTLETLKAPF